MERTLLALDGPNLIYRACFSPAPMLRSADGIPTKGPFIFLKMLLRLVREMNPSHLIVALESPRESLIRRMLDPGYKANRTNPRDPDVDRQFDLSLQLLAALEIPTVSALGHEADDVLCSIAWQYARAQKPVTVVTADKDLHQLVGPNSTCYDPYGSTLWDMSAVRDRWGVPPMRVVEVQALAGDRMDGFQGVPGIGLKTAQLLIDAYGTAVEAWENREHCMPGVRKKLNAVTRQHVELQRKLARLENTVNLPKLKTWEFHGLDLDKGRALFNYLGFKSWAALKAPPIQRGVPPLTA